MTRRHVLVHESETCNVFLIEWPVGTGLDWHDHGRSKATIQMLEGVLVEYVESGCDVFEDRLFIGVNRFMGAGVRHKVVNEGDKTAVSLHTYRPPLTVEYSEDLEIGGLGIDIQRPVD